MLAGFTDPDGDELWIYDTWTDYGSLTFDYDSLTASLPVSNSQNLDLDMIIDLLPGGDEAYLTGLSFTVPEYLAGSNLDLYYQLTYDKGGDLDVSQTLKINSLPEAPTNSAPVLTGTQTIFPILKVGQEFPIWESDLLAGFTDPDGDDIYINETWTDYGSLTFDYGSLTAYLPISNNQELIN